MSVYKIQMPDNYPEESIQNTEHGKSLKSRKPFCNEENRIIRQLAANMFIIVIHSLHHLINCPVITNKICASL
jgi:hypothetical protein